MSGLTLHQRVEWMDGRELRKGTVATTWNSGADAMVLTDAGAVMHVTAAQLGIPTETLEVSVDLDDAHALALRILSGKPPSGSVSKQTLMLAAAVVKMRLQGGAA